MRNGLVRRAAMVIVLLGCIHAVQGSPETGADWDATISLEFTDAPLREVFEKIGTAGKLHIRYDDKVDQNAKTSASLSDVSLRAALRFVSRANRLFVVERGPQEVLIAPDTWEKRKELMPRGERTFQLVHADPRTVCVVLRSILQARHLESDEEKRTVTMTDMAESLELAEVLIERIDRPANDPIVAADREPLWVGTEESRDLGSLGDSVPQLEIDMEQPLTLGSSATTAQQFYGSLTELTGVQLLFDRKVDLEQPIDISLSGIPAEEALKRVNGNLGLFSVVWGPRTVFIAPDTSGRRLAEEHVAIQFYYLSNADTRSVVTALRSGLQVRQIAEIPRLNAVVIRDTVPTVEAAEELVRGLDEAGSVSVPSGADAPS